MAETPVVVTVTDPVNGETQTGRLRSGMYVLVCVEPKYLYSTVEYDDGTVVLTLKKQKEQTQE